MRVPPGRSAGSTIASSASAPALPGFGRVRTACLPSLGHRSTRGEHATAWRTDRAASRCRRRRRRAPRHGRDRRGVRRLGRRLREPPHRAQRRRHLGDQQRRRHLRAHQQAHRPGRRRAVRRPGRQPRHRPAGRRRRRGQPDRQPAHLHRPVDPCSRPRARRRRSRPAPRWCWPARPSPCSTPADGRVWAQRVDRRAGRAVRRRARRRLRPAGRGRQGGRADRDDERGGAGRLGRRATGWCACSRRAAASPRPRSCRSSSTSGRRSPSPRWGSGPCVLDDETGGLVVVDGGSAALPPGSVVQQPGPAAGSVVVATRTELLDVDLDTGDATALADDLSGRPTAPVRLGDCRYGAWSGGRGAVVTACDGAEPQTGYLVSDATDLVFRVNRGQILLNDRAERRGVGPRHRLPGPHRRLGRVPPRPGRAGRQRPGAGGPGRRATGSRPRPSPTTSAPVPAGSPCCTRSTTTPRPRAGSSRSARSAGCPVPATLSIGPDGQTVQITLPPDAVGATSFDYVVDDGREDVSDQASVSVRTRDVPVNGEPTLRTGYRQRDWVVASGGTLDVPVLPDWRDPRDGDPLALVSATAVGGVRSGAVARTTAAGRIRLTAPVDAGRRDRGVRRQRRDRRAGHRGARLPGPGPGRHAVVRGGRRAGHRLRARRASRSPSDRSATTCPGPTR